MIEYTPTNIRSWSLLGASGTYGLAVSELAKSGSDIIVMTADLRTFSGLNRFSVEYPERFYNVGICEQNMIGIAAGLTKEGFIPFASSYATFSTTRCTDQVRFNMGYMKTPIKIVGLASGLTLSIFGGTHMSIEDIAIMRSIPNVTIISTADCAEIMKAVPAAAKHPGPVYLRLAGSMNTPIVYRQDYDFEIGKAVTLKEGSDITIIATGMMVHNSLKAATILESENISVKVVNMHTIKPIDKNAINDACKSNLIVTVEEHSKIGGLGSAVAEKLALTVKKPPQLIIGLSDEFKTAGDYKYAIDKYGLSPEQIAQNILETYKGII